MPENHDTLYGILLDVQKQIGSISRETGEQTEKLDSLNDKVAIANGRTAKNEGQIAMLKEWRKYILGGLAVVSVFGGLGATLYVKFITDKAAKEGAKQGAAEAISQLEEKYQLDFK